jgi:hypothetical protein
MSSEDVAILTSSTKYGEIKKIGKSKNHWV